MPVAGRITPKISASGYPSTPRHSDTISRIWIRLSSARPRNLSRSPRTHQRGPGASGDGGATVIPWPSPPLRLTLRQPGRDGDDRLRLRFRIDDQRQLWVEGEELPEGPAIPAQRLGILD